MTPKIDPASLPEFPHLRYERSLWKKGLSWVGGIDEAGRGALAGPVVAAVVILPPDASLSRRVGTVRSTYSAQSLRGVRDSKQMTPLQRESWAPRIQEIALAWGVGFASAEEIDSLGIVPATKLAVTRALDSLSLAPDYLITDYLLLPNCPLPQTALVKGDRRSLTVAAASVLAKTARDALMRELDGKYPGYGFARHKGYGTPQHRAELAQWGMCAIHRKSFNIKT
ncbi:MAG: ribonuclease HII [Anaerolineales bacterium]|nr:ribonuclease HII [Anaerolineales bacterium]